MAIFPEGGNVARHVFLFNGVVDLNAVLVFVEARKGIRPIARGIRGHLLRTQEIAPAIELERDVIRALACCVVVVIPFLVNRQRDLLWRMRVR